MLTMKRLSGLLLTCSVALSAASCSNTPGGRALNGALIGGTSGAIVGSLVSSNHTTGALVGGTIGAATGAVVGMVTTPPPPSPSWF
jgi:osmotically inducible lipoprotein OsmB